MGHTLAVLSALVIALSPAFADGQSLDNTTIRIPPGEPSVQAEQTTVVLDADGQSLAVPITNGGSGSGAQKPSHRESSTSARRRLGHDVAVSLS